MPNFVKELTTCSDIGSCFQMIYNLLLTLLVVLAFMYGVYGALEYLFSAASVTKQESGKNKIINAIGAILVAFILPSVLNIINPNIFRVKWVFPRIERARPLSIEFEGIVFDQQNLVNTTPSGRYYWLNRDPNSSLYKYLCYTDTTNRLKISENDERLDTSDPVYYRNPTREIVPITKIVYEKLVNCVGKEPPQGYPLNKIIITQGISETSEDAGHKMGLAIDVVPLDGDYQSLLNALLNCGFTILNEASIYLYCPTKGRNIEFCPSYCTALGPNCPCYSEGPHLHAVLEVMPPEN